MLHKVKSPRKTSEVSGSEKEFLNKTGRISIGDYSNLDRKQELTEKDALAKFSLSLE